MNILLYSSGIDSYISYYYLHDNNIRVTPVYVNLGHRYVNIELKYIRKYRPETLILNFPEYGKMFEEYDAYIPNRNLLLCLLVSSYFESTLITNGHDNKLTIYLGGLKDDRIFDNNQDAFNRFSKSLSNSDYSVQIKSAFDFKLSKKEIIDWYYNNLLYDKDEFDLHTCTFSCYNPNINNKDPHCYSCRACFRRCAALFDYVKLKFKDMKMISNYFEEFKNNKEEYDEIRYNQTMKYLKWMLGLS